MSRRRHSWFGSSEESEQKNQVPWAEKPEEGHGAKEVTAAAGGGRLPHRSH